MFDSQGPENTKYALKVLDKQKLKEETKIIKKLNVPHYVNFLDYVLNEILILGDLEHKNIVEMIEVIDDSGSTEDVMSHSPLYMVLEFAEYGESLNWNTTLNKFELPMSNQKTN